MRGVLRVKAWRRRNPYVEVARSYVPLEDGNAKTPLDAKPNSKGGVLNRSGRDLEEIGSKQATSDPYTAREFARFGCSV